MNVEIDPFQNPIRPRPPYHTPSNQAGLDKLLTKMAATGILYTCFTVSPELSLQHYALISLHMNRLFRSRPKQVS